MSGEKKRFSVATAAFPIEPSTQEAPKMRKFSYRQGEVLAELEMAHGSLAAKSVARQVRKNVEGREVGGADYTKALQALDDRGLVSLRKGKKTEKASLTKQGYELIALLKAHPELIQNSPTREILRVDSSFKLIDLIIEESERVDSNGIHWLYPHDSTYSSSAIRDVATIMKEIATEEAVARRISSLKTDKGYIVTRHSNDSHETIVNIGVTPEGAAYHERVVANEKHKDDLGDGHLALVDEVVNCGLVGIEWASTRKDAELLKWFLHMSSPSELIEMTREELEQRKQIITERVKSLPQRALHDVA